MEMKIFTIIGSCIAISLLACLIKPIRKLGFVLLALTIVGVASFAVALKAYGTVWLINPGPTTKGTTAQALGIKVVTLAKNLNHPWSVAFLPDGRFLVTERDSGKLKLLAANGKLLREIKGIPPVYRSGQGGLFEIALHPDFERNKLLYFTFAEGTDDTNSTAVARGIFEESQIRNVQVLFRQAPKVNSDAHFGGRLAFTPSKDPLHAYYLWLTLGERFDFRDKAQTLDNHFGKIIRLFDDGSVPLDNPFIGQANKKPEIWSYGHRNVQGITVLGDGTVLTIEHGPQGGDELNKPEAGKNYGWPIITYGEEYGGGPIGAGLKQKAGMEQPLKYWVPSFAPSSLVRLSSDIYPGWKNNLFATSLAHQQLVRLEMDGLKVKKEQRLLGELRERLRDVKQGPDGKLYLLTDSDEGTLLRLDPK
jgi:aldose sugar dehydrogenase